MKTYFYKALDQTGTLTRGVLQAETFDRLEKLLLSQNKELIRARTITSFSFLRRRPTSDEIIEFCIQLQSLTQAKIPLLEALTSIHETVPNSQLKYALEAIIIALSNGRIFSHCLESYPSLFDRVFITFIEMGENIGQLSIALNSLIQFLKWEEKLKAQAKKALTYPLFLLAIIIGACGVLLVTLVPQLESFMGTLGIKPPLMTIVLLKMAHFLSEGWLYSILGIGALFVFLKTFCRVSYRTKIILSQLLFQIPLGGNLYKTALLARYFHILGHLVSARIDLLKSLTIAAKAVKNPYLHQKLREIEAATEQGRNVSDCLKEIDGIPNFIHRMVKVGEQSGDLETTLTEINYFYGKDLERRSEIFLKILEPMLLAFMGGVIGWIALAFFYPLYDALTYVDF